jgi:hypothetical protein
MPGTFSHISDPPSDPNTGNPALMVMLLLTDGSVMVNEANSRKWWSLTPDATGDYKNGTWTALAPMKNPRLYYASAVLADGRVIVAGGEYSGKDAMGKDKPADLAAAEIYDPLLDQWTDLPIPPWKEIGDAPCCVLPDGSLLLGSIADVHTASFDPSGDTWMTTGDKPVKASEETWTLLPDGSVLTVECNLSQHAERYRPDTGAWVSAGQTPVNLVQASSHEIGPAVLMPDGRVFAIGATNCTALYQPPASPNQPGTWTKGPSVVELGPVGQTIGAKDAPACLLPNGHVLCVMSLLTGATDDYGSKSRFFEFDGSTLTPVSYSVDHRDASWPPFQNMMLLLPTGQVLVSHFDLPILIYTPDGAPNPSWKPTITSVPKTMEQGADFQKLEGLQINGLSQAVAYGDDAAAATNYPLIRLTNQATAAVRYCRTFSHSTMAVATGAATESTLFTVPMDTPLGQYDLSVIANGIASDPVTVSIVPYDSLKHFKLAYYAAYVGKLLGSFGDGPLYVLGPNGPIPVDPQWPGGEALAHRARTAWTEIRRAVTALETLGKEAVALRKARVPPRHKGGAE